MSPTSFASAPSSDHREDVADQISFPGIAECPVCGGDRVHYSFSLPSVRVVQCSDCSFSFCAETRCAASMDATVAGESLARLHRPVCGMLDKVAKGLAITI